MVFNESEVNRMLSTAGRLGFSVVGLTFEDFNVKPLTVEPPENLKVVWRIDLTHDKAQPKTIDKLRKLFPIVAVSCSSRDQFRAALKTRTDLIFQKKLFTLTLSDVRVLASSGKFFEFNLKPLIYARGFEMVKAIRTIRRNIKLLKKMEIPIVISSWASNTYELTSPLELPQFLALADVNVQEFYRCVSEEPARLVELSNSRRIGLPNGVRILKRENHEDV
ncbi:MAG: RNase P subunit p30 family protein [Candidatus Bathyarchaeia archaeon]